MQEAMQQALKDPQVAQQMQAIQEAMKKPEVAAQVEQMTAAMQDQQLQERIAQLKDDPELAGMFEDIQKNGMSALMKYWNDPKTLAKIGERMGPVAEGAAAAPQPQAAAAASMPEINNLLDAAKHGDLEAVQDFLAIGKDVNERDGDGRSALHYAVAYSHGDIVEELISSGADLEARDSKENTPLHYAAGYGRSQLVRQLLEAGAQAAAENANGQSALDLVTAEPRNPINKDADTLTILEHAVTAGLQMEGA
ncbi:probable Myotrophin at C-terminar half [Coccomyxa sp. Obi]|nr:probable Myotrophin at C-terminar half [Coccomyxa sp. Obi]